MAGNRAGCASSPVLWLSGSEPTRPLNTALRYVITVTADFQLNAPLAQAISGCPIC